jgi:hypothetical protein
LAATNLIPSVGYTIGDSAGVAVDANVAQTNRINAANLPVTPQSRAADNAIMALGAAVPGGVNTANLTAAMALLGGTPSTPVTENSLRAMLAVQTLAPAIPADAPHAALAQTLQTPAMNLPVTAENLRGLGALEAARLTNPNLEMSPAAVIAAVELLRLRIDVTQVNIWAMLQLQGLRGEDRTIELNQTNLTGVIELKRLIDAGDRSIVIDSPTLLLARQILSLAAPYNVVDLTSIAAAKEMRSKGVIINQANLPMAIIFMHHRNFSLTTPEKLVLSQENLDLFPPLLGVMGPDINATALDALKALRSAGLRGDNFTLEQIHALIAVPEGDARKALAWGIVHGWNTNAPGTIPSLIQITQLDLAQNAVFCKIVYKAKKGLFSTTHLSGSSFATPSKKLGADANVVANFKKDAYIFVVDLVDEPGSTEINLHDFLIVPPAALVAPAR